MSDVNKKLLEAVKHCHGIFDQYVSHHLAKPDYDKAAANERHRAICAETIAAAEQAQQAEQAHPCWSCSKAVTTGERADADGDCPHCGAELDLEDWPTAKQQAEPVAWHTNDPCVSSEHIEAIAKACRIIPSHTTVEYVARIVGFGHVLLADKSVQEAFVRANSHLLRTDPTKPPAVAVPDGYALVPIEPTPEMVAAGAEGDSQFYDHASFVYRAMLAAAQKGGA